MTWLLVIGFRDERTSRSEFDHMHSFFENEAEASLLKRRLEDRFGGQHQVVNLSPGARDPSCPRCGRGLQFFLRQRE